MKYFLLSAAFIGILSVLTHGKTFPTDLTGNFIYVDGNYPDKCPGSINQTTFTDGPVKYSWKLSHNTIKHDSKYCHGMADERRTIYYNSSLIPNKIPSSMKAMINIHGRNEEVNYPLNYQAKHNNETYYVGYEAVSRYCQDGSKFNNGTFYFLFRPWYPVNMPLGFKNFTFDVEWKYLIALPRYESTVCIYKAYVPGTLSEELMKPTKPTFDMSSEMIHPSIEPLMEISDEMEPSMSMEPML